MWLASCRSQRESKREDERTKESGRQESRGSRDEMRVLASQASCLVSSLTLEAAVASHDRVIEGRKALVPCFPAVACCLSLAVASAYTRILKHPLSLAHPAASSSSHTLSISSVFFSGVCLHLSLPLLVIRCGELPRSLTSCLPASWCHSSRLHFPRCSLLSFLLPHPLVFLSCVDGLFPSRKAVVAVKERTSVLWMSGQGMDGSESLRLFLHSFSPRMV